MWASLCISNRVIGLFFQSMPLPAIHLASQSPKALHTWSVKARLFFHIRAVKFIHPSFEQVRAATTNGYIYTIHSKSCKRHVMYHTASQSPIHNLTFVHLKIHPVVLLIRRMETKLTIRSSCPWGSLGHSILEFSAPSSSGFVCFEMCRFAGDTSNGLPLF